MKGRINKFHDCKFKRLDVISSIERHLVVVNEKGSRVMPIGGTLDKLVYELDHIIAGKSEVAFWSFGMLDIDITSKENGIQIDVSPCSGTHDVYFMNMEETRKFLKALEEEINR